jgi:hypothetical protein
MVVLSHSKQGMKIIRIETDTIVWVGKFPKFFQVFT